MKRLVFLIITLAAAGAVHLVAQGQPVSENALLTIQQLRQVSVKGGAFTIEENLPNGSNYKQQVVSYISEGLKIYGLLTTPLGKKPDGGFPGVVFVHGHIPPKEYSTINSYALYQPPLARSGFVTFKPDLRGHGRSQGSGSAHFSDAFTMDLLAAIAYLKESADVNPSRLGYWGHSNGGSSGLRLLVSTHDIKAASLWAGVVGSYKDMLETWNSKIRFMRVPNAMTVAHQLPSQNPEFWMPLDPYNYLDYIKGPVELHHAQGDASVPIELSRSLQGALKKAGKAVTFYEYPGDNHNINQNYTLAWNRTIQFFKDNL